MLFKLAGMAPQPDSRHDLCLLSSTLAVVLTCAVGYNPVLVNTVFVYG